MGKDDTNHRGLLSLLDKNANRLFSLLIIIISVPMFFLGPVYAPYYREAFIAISTSLVASLVFAVIYSRVAERYRIMVIKDEISQSLKEVLRDEVRPYLALHPDDYFHATDKPDKRFNTIITNSLENSRSYYFKGVTGRHIPARLIDAKPRNLVCEVLFVDPRQQELLLLYIRDRFGEWTSEAERTRRLQMVQQEIYMAIVALFDVAHRLDTRIQIGLHCSPVYNRFEIFDDVALVSYFTEKIPTAYPITYLYKKDSFFYKMLHTDFQQSKKSASYSAIFSLHSKEEDLQQLLNDIGCDINTLPQIRKTAEEFQSSFRNNLNQ